MKSPKDSSFFYNETIRFIDLNDYLAAVDSIKSNLSFLESYDDIALALLISGFLYYRLGDYDSAIAKFSESIFYEDKLEILEGRSKDISLNGRANSRYENRDFKRAVEDKRMAKKILQIETDEFLKFNNLQIDYRNILLGTFLQSDLETKYNALIKVSKIRKSKYDLIGDYKKVISDKRKEEVINKLELISESKYKIGDYKGSIKAIRRAEKYY